MVGFAIHSVKSFQFHYRVATIDGDFRVMESSSECCMHEMTPNLDKSKNVDEKNEKIQTNEQEKLFINCIKTWNCMSYKNESAVSSDGLRLCAFQIGKISSRRFAEQSLKNKDFA